MTRQELINTVKTKVDELSPLDAEIVPVGLHSDNPLDSFADGLLDECAKELLMCAPVSRVRVADCPAEPVTRQQTGYVVLPADFLRLSEFKMTEWERPVTVAYEPDSPVALRQYNRYTRGGCCKPVCVLSHRDGGRVLEYYSVNDRHNIESFRYVPFLPAEDVPADLQDVLTWWCASRVLQIIGKTNEAQAAYERGRSLL